MTNYILYDPIYWFMDILDYKHREKIRKHYKLKDPTLKITDEMLEQIYNKEINTPENYRLLDKRFYFKL